MFFFENRQQFNAGGGQKKTHVFILVMRGLNLMRARSSKTEKKNIVALIYDIFGGFCDLKKIEIHAWRPL